MLPLNNELECCKKLIEHIKLSYTSRMGSWHPRFERKRICGTWFYGTLIFQQSSMICIGRHVGQNYSLLISCETFDSYAQMCCKRYLIIFSTFSLKFKCKIWVQKQVIHNFKNHILVTWPATNLLIWRKWCRFEIPNHYNCFL